MTRATIVVFAVVLTGGLVGMAGPGEVETEAKPRPMLSPQFAAPVPLRSAVEIVGTNSLADAATINAAIAASPPGAEIVFRGTFLLNETIRLLGTRAYRGESRSGTVLKQADGANLVALMASSVFLDNKAWTGTPMSVRHLKLVGNSKNNPEETTAGLVVRSWLSVIEDVCISDMAGDGLRLTNLGKEGEKLKTTQVNGRISHCFISHSGRHGVFIEDTQNQVTDWILSDCWVASSGDDGIHLDNAAGWYVERNHIYGVGKNAISAHRLFATSIADNYIEGFGEAGEPGTWHGIYATLQGGTASTISCNRVFKSQKQKDPTSSYRYLSVSVNYGKGLISVTGNAIQGKGIPCGTGLHYVAKEGTELIVVSNTNAVQNVDTDRFVGDRVTLSPGL